MKQLWNITCSDPVSWGDLKPVLNVTTTTNLTTRVTRVQTDILGLLNNKRMPNDDSKMVASSAWMTYPVSLFDATKVNFTVRWANIQCPEKVGTPINCSPQGGFALVFQQESQTALGEFRNNLGEGLGYEGLSGVIAIEFDTYSSLHNDQPITNNVMVSVQTRNPTTKLLSSRPSASIASSNQPLNFGSFNRTDFRSTFNVSVGLIPNQFTQMLQIVVYLNGVPQIKTKASFSDLGIDPNRIFYLGFTGAQNLNQQTVATGTLSIVNFRVFKTKPKFVDGQVSYLWDYSDKQGNNSLLEIRSSFYDLCMQKTTMIVYPSVSIDDWLKGNETEPKILAFAYNRDIFVIGSIINPLNKPDFYRPAILNLLPDVKFQMSIPTGRTQAIRMGFYWGTDLIMNITAIDYFRQQQSNSFAFIVIDNSDIVTGTLAVKGYANNNYQFNIYCYDKALNPSPIQFNQLMLSVTSEYIRLNDTVYSNVVPLTCYGVQSQNANFDVGDQVLDTNRNYLFTCSFMPNVNGTYYINSPYLPSGRSFKVEVDKADQVMKVLSSEFSQAIITGDFVVDVGSMVEIYIDLRDYLNNTYKLSPEDGCTFTKSYYIQNDQKYSFLFYDGFPYLRTKFNKAGVAEFKITISCIRIEFDLQCFRCQKVIQPLTQYFYYKVSIPAYPSSLDVKLDNMNSLILAQGSNLAVDIEFYDRYDNIVHTELNDTFLSAVNVQLQYVTKQNRKTFNLNKVQIPGKVMLFLNDADNQFFKSLQPRANTYFLDIQVPKQEACFTVDRQIKNLYIVSQDKLAPIESVGDQDLNKVDPLMASVQWDRVITPGKIGRLSFTLRNANMLQMSSWPSKFITDYLDAKILDSTGKDLRGSGACQFRFGFGLYEGEYFGWYQCKPASKINYSLQLLFTAAGTTTQSVLLGQPLPFWTLQSIPTTAEKTFFQVQTQMVTLGNGIGFNSMFRMYDPEGNIVENALISADQPQLGQIMFNLTRLETGVVARYQALPMMNSSNFFRIHIDNIPIGRYRLQLDLPSTSIFTDITFNSSSQRISPFYSYAFRENGQITNVLVNTYQTVRIYARNIHNQTIERNSDSVLLMQQCRVYLTSSHGQTIMMSFIGNPFDSASGQVYYRFDSVEPLTRNGRYFVNVYFPDTNEYLYVQNGTFLIQDRFDPLLSELYLIKGLEQKEFRMIPYNGSAGLENAFNASHYDPKIDGSLRFKMYLRTNVMNEIVKEADFTNVAFKNVYLASAVYSTRGTFEIKSELLILLNIQIINNEYILVTPKTWDDQDAINKLQEGYYFIFIEGIQFSNNFSLRWIFSLYNSENDPSAIQTQMNFFAPRFINVTAGEPFTFVVAAFGNKSPKLVNVVVTKTDGLSIEIDKTSDNSPPGYIYYVTVYHEVAGIYRAELRADVLPSREIVIQVNPAPFYQVKVVDPTTITSRRIPIGTSISYNFTFVDRYGNNLFMYQRDRPFVGKMSDMVQAVHADLQPVIKFVRCVDSAKGVYQANFTTWYNGIVSLVVPFTNAQSTILWQNIQNFTFEIPTTRLPYYDTSYAFLPQKDIKAGSLVQLEIRIFDEYQNRITSLLTNVSQMYTVNVVPDNTNCNATTSVIPFNIQSGNSLVFSSSTITRACLYKVQVYQFTQNDGVQELRCHNCYLRITPGPEDPRRFEFLDARDVVVSSMNTQTIYINRFDWNPKIIMTMHDLYGNLVTARTLPELTYNYTYDLMAKGGIFPIRTTNFDQFRSFYLMSFCNENSLKTFCFQNDPGALQLRIKQFERVTIKLLSTIIINIQLVDNFGAFYNADSLNPLSSNYTHIKVLNQDNLETHGHDQMIIQDRCIGGDQYPIIGRIELRNNLGFRYNQTYASIQSRLALRILNVSQDRYQVQFYSGSTQGQILFIIFVKDDYYLDTESSIARLYIDDEEQTYKSIIIQCDRKYGYNKHLLNSTGAPQTAINIRLVAGDLLQVNLTSLPDSFLAGMTDLRFSPYERGMVYLNYTTPTSIQNGTIMYEPVPLKSIVEDRINKLQKVEFGKIKEAGNAVLLGAGIPSNFVYNITILPGPPGGQYSQVTTDTIRVTAGANVSLSILVADRFGNVLTLTNSSSDIQLFNNYTQVFYTRISNNQPSTTFSENWQLASKESCYYAQQGRMRCSIKDDKITQKGLYKLRVVMQGEIAQCYNCYFRVIPTQKLDISKTVMGDLSQNFYANKPFAMGPFNVMNRNGYIYMKYYLKDEYQNVYIHEDLNKIDDIWPRLSNSSNDVNLTATRVALGRANNALIYKVTVVQTVTAITQYSFTKEGVYNIKLVTNALGSISYSIYVKESRSSPGYIPPRGTQLTLKTLDMGTLSQQAGKVTSVQIAIFTNNDFIAPQVTTDLNFIQFSNPMPAGRGVVNAGDQIVSQYKGIYEKFQRFSTVTFGQPGVFQERFTVTINGFDSAVQGQLFQSTVFPGPMSKILYAQDGLSFNTKDSNGNDIDFSQEPHFNLQVIQQRTSSIYSASNDFSLKVNYTDKRGYIQTPEVITANISSYSLVDSTLNILQSAFFNYSSKGLVDYNRSSFNYSLYQMVAGRIINVRVSLVDRMGESIITNTTNDTEGGNITVHLIHLGTRNPTEYGKRVERIVNFTGYNLLPNGGLMKSIQVNISALYYIEVRYRGVRLMNSYSQRSSQWFYVDIDPSTGITRELQWSLSTTVVHKNKVFQPLISSQGLDYASFMKGQPIYIIARLCDKFGNYFYSSSIYDMYNVGDTALSSRIRNYGDRRQLSLNTQFVWNFMTVGATDPLNRGLVKNFVPSFFPLVNDALYDNQKSFKLDIYSPSNTTTQNVNLKVIFLVITSDFNIDKYHSANVTNSQELDLTKGGLFSSDFDGGQQIKIRQSVKNLIVLQLRNDDQRPFLAEPIINFTLSVTNVTLQNQTINGKNVTIYKPLDTVNITIIPYQNDAFYRVLLTSQVLYQDPYPLNVRATAKTLFKYNINPQVADLPLWIFPQTPPNFLNNLVNTSFLAIGQSKFQPATKITFQLNLKYNGQIYMNDYQSAQRIKVFRKSNIEFVTAQLINKTTYNISVNLEGPQVNQFRIYYQDTNKALYPMISPDVLNFEINTGGPVLQSDLDQYKFEEFYYHKLGIQNMKKIIPQPRSINIQSFDPAKVRLVLIPNMFKSDNLLSPLTYYIGNEFRTSILVIDSQTSRCLLQSDYNPQRDLRVIIQRYDPVTKVTSRVSLDLEKIYLVQKTIIQSTSYCTFYSIALLESQDQLNMEGNYTMTATFIPNPLVSTNLTFQAKIAGIDYTKTTIGWYQQPTSKDYKQDQLIADFNAYEEFNYVIYFKDVQDNFVSDRQQQVKIQIKFDQQRLAQEKDYKYISRYDDRFKGYLVTITFLKAGSYQPEYYFNLQRADSIEVTNGPVLFVVREPQCVKIQILSESGSVNTNNAGVNTAALVMGQLFTLVFHCYDINGKEIKQNIDTVQAQAVFTNLNMNDELTFVNIESLQNGIYRVSHKFYLEGTYNLKVYFNNLLIYKDTEHQYQVISELCKDRTVGGSGQLLFRCPNNPSICANSYQECAYINTTRCTNVLSPFLCGIGGSGSDKCVSNMLTECCKINDRILSDYKWCPHLNQCMNVTLVKCPSILPSPAPIWCESKYTFVSNRTQCCGDLKYNVTRTVGNETTMVTKSMVKCRQEEKCVPEDTQEFCFYAFDRNCSQIFGPEFPYQCPNDGQCRRNPLECPSPKVCPTGYIQCPDFTCIRGLDKFSQCNKLSNCTRSLPDGSVVEYIRCPDGTCSRTYEDCPTQMSCMTPGQVVCPDGSCKNTEFECIQPNDCTSDRPYKCPGFPSTCATSKQECPQPSSKSCGGTQLLCANSDCASQCLKSSDYYSNANGLVLRKTCASQGLVQCPNFECRSNYFDCSDTLYCPVPINYTYSPSSIICPSAQICALNRQDCSYSSCGLGLNTQFLPSLKPYDTISFTQSALETCYDGRCHLEGRQKQQVCMTPISCSNGFIKSGGFGEYCVSSIGTSQTMMELSILLNDYQCPLNKVKCVTGECRSSVDDCPTQVTCPSDLPIQCRDGQCVKSKILCNKVDQAIERNLQYCSSLGMLLCTSDLITCTQSLSQCPSRSSCPIGYIKCWDESCINLENNEQCPPTVSTKLTQRIILSTCPELEIYSYHCFSDGSCRANLEDCPSISYCPTDRPVKCAFDNSCRKSIKNCPSIKGCPNGYKFCPGEGTCIQLIKTCGTPITCPSRQPYRCEDGNCVTDLSTCFKQSHSLSQDQLTCIQHGKNYLCMNTPSLCTSTLLDCPSTTTCIGSNLVKSTGKTLCFPSRQSFSADFIQDQESGLVCYLSNQYRCPKSGKCQDEPCEEWLRCPLGQIKCADGTCASNEQYCRASNGCPAYLPVRCKFSGKCVNESKSCEDENVLSPRYQEKCDSRFGLQVPCAFDGSCAQSVAECKQSTECKSSKKRKENGECYVPACPEQIPFKCANGLCVKSKIECPLSPFSFSEIQYCSVISDQTGLDLNVPCGNGECMESSDQCLPLYDCSMNINTDAIIRCPDGSCKSKLSQCSQDPSASPCPSHVPFLCQNGMCAISEGECLRNDNGCPESRLYKCPQTGQCTQGLWECANPMNEEQMMFNFPNYIPPKSTTPLIAIYGKTRSICQNRGQFTCRLKYEDAPYCVDRLNDCISFDNGCPVNQPIRCGNTCVTSYLECLSDNCNALIRCPSQQLTSNQCVKSDISTCLNIQGCPLNDQSFKCTTQLGRKPTCGNLPFTTYVELYSQTCKTYDRQLSISPVMTNECQDSDTPYSCADGSCVSSLYMCPTCVFYCTSLRRCVRSSLECTFISSQQANDQRLINLQLNCPLSTPTRCIVDGNCVSDESKCEGSPYRMNYNMTFVGALITEKCPFSTPIRCQDGRCVAQYDYCIIYQRTRLNKTDLNDGSTNALNNPLKWGQSPNFSSKVQSCSVLCFDGSCRDRVENCPIIQGCFDPQRPYRCRSGFCGRDKDQCIQLYGKGENSDTYTLTDSCQDLSTQSIQYRRCEDGTCRPVDTCLPYMGCPLSKPYQCSTGECSNSLDGCAGKSQCPLDTPFRCKNFKCVQNMYQCDRQLSQYSSLQIERTFDPLIDTEVNFAYDQNGYVIAKLLIPSNALGFNISASAATSQIQTLQRLQIYPVPDSILDKVDNVMPASRLASISRIYSLTDGISLSRGLSLLSPAVKFEVSSLINNAQVPQLMDPIYLQQQVIDKDDDTRMLQRPFVLQFKIDEASFPGILNMKEDICLGKIHKMDTFVMSQTQKEVQNNATWQCEQRDYEQTEDGFLKFRVSTWGIYAVIIKPNPDIAVGPIIECGFLCQNHLTILIVLCSIVVVLIALLYAISECCKSSERTKNRVNAENKRLSMMMTSQQDSFFGGGGGDYLNSSRLGRSNMPAFITQDAFIPSDQPSVELDLDKVKDVLDNVDPSDPPLMPGQVVMYLAHQNENQGKQIEELRYQLQEQNEREKENLKLIKRIFHQKQLIYEQIQVESDLKSQSRKSRSTRNKRKKEVINDPNIKQEYEDIEAYLSKILSETHLPDAFDPKASAATFQLYPNRPNTMKIIKENPTEMSFQSNPVEQIQPLRQTQNNPLNTESMQRLFLAGQKQTQSTTNLELNDAAKLKRKAADLLLQNLNDDIDEFKYDEHAEDLLRLRRTQQQDGGENPNLIEEEFKDDDNERSNLLERELNTKYSRRETTGLPSDEIRMHQNIDDVSATGIDSNTLSQTLNQLFSKARKPGGGPRQYSMLMSGGAVSGTVSGNLVKALNKRFQQELQPSQGNSPSTKKSKAGGMNGTFDGDDSEEEEEAFDAMLPYEDYKEPSSKNSSAQKNSKSPKK